MQAINHVDCMQSASTEKQGAAAHVRKSPLAARILIVEDDADISSLLVYTMESAHLDPVASADCKSAWKILTEYPPDLVLLDWMLPDMSGIELLQRIRGTADLAEMPVIMLTARAEESDRVRGLDSGADDYIVKPFSTRELCARINSRLRKFSNRQSCTLEIGGLSLDQKSYRTSVNGDTVTLGPTEFRLLRHFMSNIERVYSRGQLLDHVWGTNVYIEERTVDVHVRRLRKALQPFNKDCLIQTVRGAGYRFSARD